MIKRIVEAYRRRVWSSEKYARRIGVMIGKECLISSKNFSSEPYLIKIGDYCRIASGVSFFTHGGLWSQRKRTGKAYDAFGKITIGDYTYIGQDSKIMPGVVIGDNVIVGAGTVVTKSIPDGKIVAGNPGRVVGEVEDFLSRINKVDLNTKDMTNEKKKVFLLSLKENSFIRK